MKCMLKGTVVGRGVFSRDGREYPWVDVYTDGECPRVYGYPLAEFGGLSEGEVIEWPVRVYVGNNGRLGVRYQEG